MIDVLHIFFLIGGIYSPPFFYAPYNNKITQKIDIYNKKVENIEKSYWHFENIGYTVIDDEKIVTNHKKGGIKMLGALIKQYIEDKGLKQIRIAEKSGIRPSRFNELLNGKRQLEATEYFKICDVLGVPIELFAKQLYEKQAV